VPRALWGIWERGTIGLLSRDLASPFLRDVWTEERKQRLVGDFVRTNLHDHNFYAMRFFLCELLNFLNSVGHNHLRISFSFFYPLSLSRHATTPSLPQYSGGGAAAAAAGVFKDSRSGLRDVREGGGEIGRK